MTSMTSQCSDTYNDDKGATTTTSATLRKVNSRTRMKELAMRHKMSQE